MASSPKERLSSPVNRVMGNASGIPNSSGLEPPKIVISNNIFESYERYKN